MRGETLRIAALRPYWRNPRNVEPAVDAVAESIKRYGYNAPIIVDEDYTIIVGHTRYRALRKLGWEEVFCVISDLPPEKAQEYRIADNKTAEFADWNDELLIQELMEIEDPSFARTFFSDDELSRLIPQSQEIPEDPSRGYIPEADAGPSGSYQQTSSTFGAYNAEQYQQQPEGDNTEGDEPTGMEIMVMCPECAQEQAVWVPFNKEEVENK